MVEPDIFRSSFRRQMLWALRRYRDRVALTNGTETWTYADLEQRVLGYASGFARAGLKPGDGVGLLSRNTLDYAALQVAVPLAGMYFMCLYELEATPNHLAQIEYGNLRALVVDPATVPGRAEELSSGTGGDLILLSLGGADGTQDLNGLVSGTPPPLWAATATPDPSSMLEIGLTGGTTGQAKGVIDTDSVYANLALLYAANYELPENPRMLLSTPLSHGIGSVALRTIFLMGGSVILHEQFDPDRVLQTIERDRVNSLLLVPTSVHRVLDSSIIAKTDTSSLECLIYGGATMSPDRVAEAVDRFGPVLVQQYGGREAKVVSRLSRRDHDPSRPDILASAGRANIGVQLEILDEDLQPVPVGEVGEICTRSPASVPGYWNRPEETAALHRGGWVHSGDLGVLDDRGFVTIKDRIKQIIISGGHNVVPREVEDALAAHPDVALAAVFGVPDRDWGEVVTAAIVMRPGATTSTEDLRAFVKLRAGSANTPKSINLYDHLPLTTAGKVDKNSLRDAARKGTN